MTSAVVGDKAVAAKAVAFVVSSTRKGIVAHCADVANLLRAKQRYIMEGNPQYHQSDNALLILCR